MDYMKPLYHTLFTSLHCAWFLLFAYNAGFVPGQAEKIMIIWCSQTVKESYF